MKKRLLSILLGTAMITVVFCGCSGGEVVPSLVNTLKFDTDRFQNIELDYDADGIILLEGQENKVVIKEYMSKNKKTYYAQTTEGSGSLLVTEGKRPFFSELESYIELYIPQSYQGNLAIHSTSGTIETSPLEVTGDLRLDTTESPIHASELVAESIQLVTTNGEIKGADLTADKVSAVSTNGSVGLSNITAAHIKTETTGADVTIKNAVGNADCRTKNGSLTIDGLEGGGSFNISGDGKAKLHFTKATGDIAASTKNGSLEINLPKELSFKFSAAAKNGTITTPFNDLISVGEKNAAGVIGKNPKVLIELTSKNGNITVR
ncbi:DUF4097 domain-containing protein [Anaerovorax odorimutans]|uniref:DUF4097 domain-containing protein n=1 Tax=Anaerovorax odorimutans TaxID=109327 RepID=A0ABT1RQ56_9FIRM|nr:DUF4097 family beta strand repeat-containing protein [Anaerovorax odorimutans]MCQ4637299.1 DUF4097 domain-containing protein [Anaerovorax odorimutans]